jgi:thiol-disulfide isomerase/thioredoxin
MNGSRAFSCLVLTAALLAGATRNPAAASDQDRPAPEFTARTAAEWINSAPLTLAGLKGRPILIEFWTYGCVNCLRSLDWMKHVEQKYARSGLAIVSVHTPEFSHERSAANVRAAVERLGIEYPVMLDSGSRYWQAMNNRYWPAFYLVDASGRVVATAIGEMHVGERRSLDFERRIDALGGG